VKFHELSDEGLDMTDRLVKGFWARAGRDLSGWIIDHVNDQIPPFKSLVQSSLIALMRNHFHKERASGSAHAVHDWIECDRVGVVQVERVTQA
jgi:hypothetical protein